ncbi:MAG TPA: NADP-dependent malic enzyme, partial [Mizugakiibacter sp.]|nr:NADP-dependent malic enzyme [Mizugakiibacter sp.]
MICGLVGRYQRKLAHVLDVIGYEPGVSHVAAMSVVVHGKGVHFFLDTYVEEDPDARQIAEATLLAAARLKLFGIVPKVALLAGSNFGSRNTRGASKMREALTLIRKAAPELEVEGEMQADAAVVPEIREHLFPNANFSGPANLLVFPDLDSANISFNLVRSLTDGVVIGPILMGAAKPVHILTPSATVRRLVNMTAIACVDAQIHALATAK